MRFRALLFVAILALPFGAAQLPPTPLDPLLTTATSRVHEEREKNVGPELRREDVDVFFDITFDAVDFDAVNVIFGGGRFEAQARIDARIDMRVLAASRVRDAVSQAAPASSNLTAVALSEADFIPADAFRATLTAEALRAFQDEQEERLADYIAATLPGVHVLSTSFGWANTTPQDSYEGAVAVPTSLPSGQTDLYDFNDPTFPPLTVSASARIQYVEHTSLLAIIERALAPKTEEEKERKDRVADAAAGFERSAFGLLGLRQVLDVRALEGWNIVVRLTLPEGYTFEEASPDVVVADDLRMAHVVTLGKEANGSVLNPVSLTLSNRFLVSTALLGAVLLCGAILRFGVTVSVSRWRRKMRA